MFKLSTYVATGRSVSIALLILLVLTPRVSFAFDTTANSQVFAMLEQSDGRVIIAGTFTAVIFSDDSVAFRSRIARLNDDGSLDESFDIGSGADGPIFAIALQSNGKILIGGEFDHYNDTARNGIARLNSDGSLDTSFAGGSGFNGPVLALAVQPDGKVLAGGNFDTVRGNTLNNIARLESDSSVDQDFDPGEGTNAAVRAIALQNDGKIVMGGDFTTVNLSPRGRFARLNVDGGLDSSLGLLARADSSVRELVIQNDGKVLIAGEFTNVGGQRRNRIARINSSGFLDSGFTAGTGANGLIEAMALQPDDKILIGGAFTVLRGASRIRVARLNPDSSVDVSFDASGGPDDIVSSVLRQSNGKVLIGGFFANVRGVNKPHLARLLSNGFLDKGVEPESCFPIKGANEKVAVVCF